MSRTKSSLTEDGLKAMHNLFITVRTFMELAEPIDEMECIVNTDNLEDLNSAYREVVRIYGPSLHGFNTNTNQKGE